MEREHGEIRTFMGFVKHGASRMRHDWKEAGGFRGIFATKEEQNSQLRKLKKDIQSDEKSVADTQKRELARLKKDVQHEK